MYSTAIYLFDILQDRHDNFYAKYLYHFSTITFHQNEQLGREGRNEEKVLFILKGIVLNISTNKFFRAGHLINHDCIFKMERQCHTYIANSSEVTVLALDKFIFLNIVDEFDDFEESLLKLIQAKQSIETNDDFIKDAVADRAVRKQIHKQYKHLNTMEREVLVENNRSPALKFKSKVIRRQLKQSEKEARKSIRKARTKSRRVDSSSNSSESMSSESSFSSILNYSISSKEAIKVHSVQLEPEKPSREVKLVPNDISLELSSGRGPKGDDVKEALKEEEGPPEMKVSESVAVKEFALDMHGLEIPATVEGSENILSEIKDIRQ